MGFSRSAVVPSRSSSDNANALHLGTVALGALRHQKRNGAKESAPQLRIILAVVYFSMNTKIKDYTEPLKSQVSEKLQNVQERVGETARNVTDATDRYVRDNPWKTIALVALAACMVGYLLSAARD